MNPYSEDRIPLTNRLKLLGEIMSGPSRILLSPCHMGKHERDLLLDAFDSNWIAPVGPHVDGFEKDVAALVGSKHAVALSAGTAAIHLALRMLGVGPGDRVMASTLTFAATINPIVYQGADPVLIDCDYATWNMDPNLLESELKDAADRNELPKAVVVVDLYGQCADYDPIVEMCDRYEVPIVEDAAEALGSTYRGRHAGTLTQMGVYSFNGNKIITTSGGGMLVTDNAEWAEMGRHLATQAREPVPHYQHTKIGYNYRLSNLLAAIGRGQLQVLPDRVAARRENNRHYRDGLADIDGLRFMPEADFGVSNCWLTAFTLDPKKIHVTAEQIRQHLDSLNIEARNVWKPMHLQPVFRDCRVVGGAVSEDLFQRGLCLPSGSSLTYDDRLRVIEGVKQAIANG